MSQLPLDPSLVPPRLFFREHPPHWLLCILDALPVVVWIADPAQQEIVFSNRALDIVWDIDFGNDRRVERLRERVHPDDLAGFMSKFWRFEVDGTEIEYRIIRRDGSIRWLRSRGVPVPANSDELQVVVGITQDVTTEHERSEAERRMLCRLMQADRLATLGALSAALAHDLRHHLHGLTMATGVVTELVADLTEISKHRGYPDPAVAALCQQGPDLMSGIAESLMRLQAQVDDMRQHGREPMLGLPQQFDAVSTVRSVLRLAEPYLRSKGAVIRVAMPDTICLQNGWSTQVEQAALNLLTNAAEALDRPGLSVTVSLISAADSWSLTVEDGGPGIPSSLHGVLGRSAHTTKSDGTGLGWTIIARCMRRHGGSWNISTSMPRGTRVELVFPTADAP